MKTLSQHPVFFVLLLALSASCAREPSEPFARAKVIESLEEVIGGEKSMARPGDLLLENDRVRVAILSARTSMGPGLFGGSLVDADLQARGPGDLKGGGNDRFAELIPTVNMNVPWPAEGDVEVLQDGSGGGEAIVRVSAPAEPFLTLLKALWGIVGSPDFHMVTDYIAEPGKPWIRIRTTAIVEPDSLTELPEEGEPVDYADADLPVIEWAIENGLAMGDFYLSGGSVDVFGPDMGFDEDGAVLAAQQRGENTFAYPFEFEFLAGTADGISYGLAPVDGLGFVPLFTASQTIMVGGGKQGADEGDRFPDGSAYTYERFLFIGHGDVGSVVDGYLEARGIPFGEVSGHVIDTHTGEPQVDTDVIVYRPGAGEPWSQWRTDVHPDDTNPDGSFGGRLPVGQWELMTHRHGVPDGPRVPITVAEGERVEVAMPALRGGVMEFTVSDEVGRQVPAKVTVYRVDDAPSRDPVLGDGFIGGDPEAVVFAMYGTGQVELSPGRYVAVATRGIEYEIDESPPFDIDGSQSVRLDLQVLRSVETDGWISADFHVHSNPSHDSGVALADRVMTMACEGVEFFSSTDHDQITDFAPVIEDLGLEDWVQSAVGSEVTTIELGHYLGFPLAHDYALDAGGALDWTDEAPGELVAGMREISPGDPFIYVGHPRDGILGYFDQFGYDPFAGNPGDEEPPLSIPTLSFTNPLISAENATWDFDGLELLNGKRIELLRTPLQSELDAFADQGDVPVYEFLSRTMEEQEALESGEATPGYGFEGQIDDWFSLLNLGFRYTAVGNSDTHGITSTEAGCPRNFVMSDTDQPAFLDDQVIAEAVRQHRVVASYGPFVRMLVDGAEIGSDVEALDGEVDIDLEVQSPTWMGVERVELYVNGALVREWELPPGGDVLKFAQIETLSLDEDSWIVAIVMGPGDLSPMFSPVEIPYIDLTEVVTEALDGVPAVEGFLSAVPAVPRIYPAHPFALTNPVWVDVDGGGFDPPGLPDWWVRPEDPDAEE